MGEKRLLELQLTNTSFFSQLSVPKSLLSSGVVDTYIIKAKPTQVHLFSLIVLWQ